MLMRVWIRFIKSARRDYEATTCVRIAEKLKGFYFHFSTCDSFNGDWFVLLGHVFLIYAREQMF